MKDYERLYEACKILDKYTKNSEENNLKPDSEMIYLCFDVGDNIISSNDLNRLYELGCCKNPDYYHPWYMNIFW